MSWQIPMCAPLLADMASLSEAAQALEAARPTQAAPLVLPRAAPPAGMSLSVLPTGHIVSRAALAFQGGRFDEVRRFALHGVLVRHPAGDLLFDTGIGQDWTSHRAALPWLMRRTTQVVPGQPAAQQLAAHGHGPASLAAIVLTHAHWDHVSGVQDFPGVPVWMSAAEARYMHSGHRSMRVARGIADMAVQPIAFDDGPYLGFPSSKDLWSDGAIVLVPAPGHTPGSILVFITLPSGRRLALIGDVVWQMEGIEQGRPKPWLSRLLADHSPAEVQAMIVALGRLHRQLPDIALLPAHDERAMAAWPVWPQVAT